MIYGSVCSGIEAATQAWHPLGWKPAFFSEIDPFPRAVLQHHYSEVPLHGDFTTIERSQYRPIDLLVGGTPCQSFSIAGLRGGLGDDRGNLALEYLRLADRLRPRWLVWENVPGVLSSNGGRDFGSILGGMVELGYGVSYRVLDAQFVRTLPFPWAVPQRRRRVFVVGCFGDWRRAAAVLFDRESLSGHPAPRRKSGQVAAHTISARPTGGGGLGTDFDLDGGLVANSGDVGYCLAASAQQSLDAETETLIAQPVAFAENTRGEVRLEGGDGMRAGARSSGGGKPGQGVPCVAIQERAVSENPDAGPQGAVSRTDGASYTLEARNKVQAVAHSLKGEGFDASEDGTGRGTPIVPTSTWQVRRLMPVECERLQGFPDGFTDVPWRGKDFSPDGRRYKALGNSMAVNVMRWIGDRIALVDTLP